MIVDFKNGIDFKTIEKRSLAIDIVDTPHKYGLGGLHGALSGYINETTPMLIADVNSYYPSMMIVYDFLSRNCENKKDFKNLYTERFRLKKMLDTKEYIFKILLNSAYGASKSYYNSLYDPMQANNICINGQIMLTDLIIRLQNYTKLIQSNTDGILFDYKDIDVITDILHEWENNYNLKLGIDKVKAIYQRDVNNYIIVKEDGKVKCKGMFKNYKGNDFQRNSLSVIPIALKNYYVDKIPIEKTVNDLLEHNNLLPFQLIAKKSSKYDALAYHDLYSDEMVVLEHKVYRVFAGINQNIGKLYKMADGSFDKYANSPNHIYINNNEIDKIDKNLIDKSFYINLCKSYLIENMNRKVKITNKKTGDIEWLI
ncbi:DNA polymerase domain-containing protein [Sneathia sanguinegens]|uniref:DNA polymerase domain-containing protein n=1 Tax=Sneathia sanguinegens TaxID=40543 RepID=A0ABT7HJV5_9FUSO|nr:DNA polymerase domain-containing protein [Sneathia sanguinegens]MDK9580808.1 DNA polymerase domain-containing protein [Sneathia sanguinegens]